ncbi:fatty acid--CoA ligase family protein [bacterium]|nr:fatty acid--CoA ligase family protein [bacterium]MDB4603799.1 fatty acid--CoA ligase family protein [bacterium]
MEILSDILEARDAGSPALRSTGKDLSSGELSGSVRVLREGALKEVSGQSVTLLCRDIPAYTTALIALDGWSMRILLADDSIDRTQLEKFEAKLEVAFRVTALEEGFEVTRLSKAGALLGHTHEALTEWVVPTSGTTGEPKLIAHDLRSLTRSVKRPTELSSTICWGLLYSPTRFAGVQVILQALAGGSCLAVPAAMTPIEAAVKTLSSCGCNALSATPSLWRKLAFAGLLSALELKYITLGGEASDQKILDTLQEHYPAATIRHIYASTEAGVGFSVADGLVGFPVDYLQNSPPGVALKISDEGMLLLRPTKLYQKLLSGGDVLIDVDGWIASGDIVEQKENRYHFLGRENGAINVGGQKVHPTTVEAVLSEIPDVQATHVFGKPNPILGALVAAEIVARPEVDTAQLKKLILEHCKDRLEPFQTPAVIHFVEDFELTPAGKVKR